MSFWPQHDSDIHIVICTFVTVTGMRLSIYSLDIYIYKIIFIWIRWVFPWSHFLTNWNIPSQIECVKCYHFVERYKTQTKICHCIYIKADYYDAMSYQALKSISNCAAEKTTIQMQSWDSRRIDQQHQHNVHEREDRRQTTANEWCWRQYKYKHINGEWVWEREVVANLSKKCTQARSRREKKGGKGRLLLVLVSDISFTSVTTTITFMIIILISMMAMIITWKVIFLPFSPVVLFLVQCCLSLCW